MRWKGLNNYMCAHLRVACACVQYTPFTCASKPGWRGLTRSHGPLNPGSTRVQPGLQGVKLGYECIGNRDFHSLQFPAISFLNERLLYLTQTVIRCKYAVDLDSKRSSRILACAVLWRRLHTSQAMSIVRRKLRRAAHLLRSHMIERRMIRQKTQTPNAIFSHYNPLLLYVKRER